MIIKSYIPVESLLDLRRGDIIRLKNSSLSFVIDHAPSDVEENKEIFITAIRSITVFDPSEILKLER